MEYPIYNETISYLETSKDNLCFNEDDLNTELFLIDNKHILGDVIQ